MKLTWTVLNFLIHVYDVILLNSTANLHSEYFLGLLLKLLVMVNLRSIYITVMHMCLLSFYQNFPLGGATHQHIWSIQHCTVWHHNMNPVFNYTSVSACVIQLYKIRLLFLFLDYKLTLWSGVHYSAQIFNHHFNGSDYFWPFQHKFNMTDQSGTATSTLHFYLGYY